MERLTMRDVGGTAFWVRPQSPGGGYRLTEDAQDQKRLDRLAAYEDAMPLEWAQELAQAEKDGRLVVLPCKVGDTVYEANKRGFVSTYKVISVHISDCSVLIGWELIDGIYSNLNGFEVSALAKTIFRTREEAEAALKKMEVDNEAD